MANLAQTEGTAALLERCSPGLVPELKGYVDRHRSEVVAMIRTGGPEAGLPAAHRYAKAVDGLLSSLFCAVRATMQADGSWHACSLAAVGSYGRGAIALHSDLDVRLLCASKTQRARPIAEALLYPLWDAGLTMGHQVVTVGDMIDLAKSDLPTATTLLDWRSVAGDAGPTNKMLGRAFEGVFGPGNLHKFLERLESQGHERHERYGGSVYLLEPDVRNGQGGLRDLDVAHWAARARWRIGDLSDLVRIGVLVPREWQQIESAREQLWRVRNLLHLAAGRRSDRLSFDRQESLASDLGHGSGGAGVERFMSEYYRHARVIAQAREMILQRAAPPPKRRPSETHLGRGLKLTNGLLSFEDPAHLEGEPALALRLYDEAVRRDLPVYNFARGAVARAVTSPAFCERLRASTEAAELFTRLCTVVQRTKLRDGSVLKELHDVGLLVAMVPEFSPVVGRVHHDVYHVYTVDVHSVAAVDRLRELCRGELASEHPLPSRLAAEIARPTVLFFATLLHDVGKDIGGKNHSERGFELARSILERLQLPDADIREVQHLVGKHLRMYHVATRRDIDDPRTLEEFSVEVHGAEGLRELYLLTVSDVSTTSPTALTNWKSKMLEELYVATNRLLSEGPQVLESRAEEVKREVLELCPDRGERDFLEHYLGAVPQRYLYANDATEIVRHSRFARQAQEKSYAVIEMTRKEPYVELAVIANDRPGLLAKITACFAAVRLKVVGAQIYSWRDTFGRVRALDLFWVRSGTTSAAARALLPRIDRDLGRLLGGEISPRELVAGKKGSTSRYSDRPAPPVGTRVGVDNRASATQTVVEVTTRDQMGLLFWLSNAFQEAGLSIALAKINTEGARVADVFYVTDKEGRKVVEPERIRELEARIYSAIAEMEGQAQT